MRIGHCLPLRVCLAKQPTRVQAQTPNIYSSLAAFTMYNLPALAREEEVRSLATPGDAQKASVDATERMHSTAARKADFIVAVMVANGRDCLVV